MDTATLDVEWKIGDVVDGRFEVKELIGRGGMGTVYRVTHREWNLDLAVKLPLPEIVASRESKERLIREAQTWVDLGVHPHIVQCWFVREWSGVPALFLDYLTGGSLKDWRKNGFVSPGEWDKILDLVIQACDGLHHAHLHGVIHRDIKPANLLIRGDDRLCVTDFGLVKVGEYDQEVSEAELSELLDLPMDLEEGASLVEGPEGEESTSSFALTRTGTLLGTPEYGAPEQWMRARGVGVQADVYALGIVLYELCCGRRPFDDGKKQLPGPFLIGRHLSKAAPDPREFYEDIPESLVGVTLRCLRKEPGERPGSMLEMRQELAEVYREVCGEAYLRPVPEAGEQRADALNNKAVSLYYLGKREDALGAWEEAMRYDAQHPESAYNRSIVQWRMGLVSDREVSHRLSRLKPSFPRAGVYLGYFLLERNLPDQAERELESALKDAEASDNGTAHRALGDARMYQEKFYGAEQAYGQAMARMPDDRQTVLRKRMAFNGSRRREGHSLFPGTAPMARLRRKGKTLAMVMAQPCRCFETDGRSLLAWDVDTGTSRWAWEPEQQDARSLTGLALSGDYLFAVGTAPGCVWSMADGSLLMTLEGHRRFLGAGPTPGTALVADNELELVSLPDGAVLTSFGEGSAGVSVARAYPGGLVLTGRWDGGLRVWKAAGGMAASLAGHTAAVEALALSPTGDWMISGDTEGDVRLWDLGSGDCRFTLTLPGACRRLEVSPEGDYVVAISAEGSLVIDPERVHTSALQPGFRAAVTADCRHLFTCGEEEIRLFELPAMRELRAFPVVEVNALEPTSDGRFLVTGCDGPLDLVLEFDESHRVYERALVVNRTQTHVEGVLIRERFLAQLRRAEEHFERGETAAAYRAVCQARSVTGYGRDKAALALNLKLMEVLPRKGLEAIWEVASTSWGGRTDALALSEEGAVIVTGDGNAVRRWCVFGTEPAERFTGHEEQVTAVAVSQDGALVVSGSLDETVRVWTPDGRCRAVLPGHTGGVGSLAITPDGRFAVVRSREQRIELWDLSLGNHLRSIEGVPGEGRVLAITPDCRYGLTAGESGSNTLRLWDLPNGRCLLGDRGFKGLREQPEGGCALAATISSDGRFAVTGSPDMELWVWELSSGRCLTRLAGHADRISGLGITADARFALSAGCDGTLRLWCLPDNECIQTVMGPDPLMAVALDQCSRYAATVGAGGTVRLWELDWKLDSEGTPSSLAEQTQGEGLVTRLTSLFRRR